MEQLESFRQEVRDWLEANCPMSMRSPAGEDEMLWSSRNISFQSEDQKLWFERMRDRGWFTPDWPRKYGGGGLDRSQIRILEQEMKRLNCRPPQINLGIWMLGPVLLEFATEEQKQTHLPPMARGEMRWCQGFSEPNAGSDLASLQMKAVPDGDEYIVSGSKIWTSYADKSDAIYCLVRTDPNAKKHEGISFLLIDMASPGITIKPIELISGKSHFCEVFFDDVKVPKSNLIGKVNDGWRIAKRLMQHERSAIANLGDQGQCNFRLGVTAKSYYQVIDGKIADAVVRDRIAGLDMDELSYVLTLQRAAEEAKQKGGIGPTASIFKYYSTELEKRKTETLVSILGSQGLGWSNEGNCFSQDELSITRGWLLAKAMSIGGGTSEIQLNIIAKQVLGLPTSSST